MYDIGKKHNQRDSNIRFKTPFHKALYFLIDDFERFFLNPLNRLLDRHEIKPSLGKDAAKGSFDKNGAVYQDDAYTRRMIHQSTKRALSAIDINKWPWWSSLW